MFKYKDYILNENKKPFKKGDKAIFNTKTLNPKIQKYNGKECTIESIDRGLYSVVFDDGFKAISVYLSELNPINKNSNVLNKGDIAIFNSKKINKVFTDKYNGKKCVILEILYQSIHPMYRIKFIDDDHVATAMSDELTKDTSKIENKLMFKEGDEVYYNHVSMYKTAKDYDNEKCVIKKVWNPGTAHVLYSVVFDNGEFKMTAYPHELSKEPKPKILKPVDKESDYDIGDLVTFYNKNKKLKQRDRHNGKTCEINHIYGDGDYQIITPAGIAFLASSDELKKANQFNVPPKSDKYSSETSETETGVKNEEFYEGQRVIVNGVEGRINFMNRKGTIKRIVKDGSLFIEIDSDDSRNLARITMMISKDIVIPLDEPPVSKKAAKGDIVKCVDKGSQFYWQNGEVTIVWNDGDVMVVFTESNGTTGIVMKQHQIKVVKAKTKITSFEDPKDTSVPVNVVKTGSEVEEEDEEEEEEISSILKSTFKKKDLLEFSYADFFDKDKTTTKEELIKNKEKYEKALEDKDVPELKYKFYERSLRTAEIIEQYYDFLVNKIAKDLPVYRTIESIENQDLLSTKTKVRASESKEMIKKYSFDQGIIAYWKFKDAVIFKTL